jgi:hypothetical protein
MRDRYESILRRRLTNQRLAKPTHRDPAAVVAWLGAVQAQDFAGAKWALGQRTKDSTDEVIGRAFDEGRILRTHVMRPTWHFVAPADIRWLQALTAARVNTASAFYYRHAGLDGSAFARSRRVIERALRDRTFCTRSELAAALGRAGIQASGPPLGLLMMRAELDALICSGPTRGKQFTYALLDERVPPTRPRGRDEALAELAMRYFASHGPASVADFAWWSGLTTRDAKTGVDAARPALARTVIDNVTYFSTLSRSAVRGKRPLVHLLPNYDELLIAHKDRALYREPSARTHPGAADHIFLHSLVIDGWLVGSWKRTPAPQAMRIAAAPFRRLTRMEQRAVAEAADRYSAFLGVPVRLAVDASV